VRFEYFQDNDGQHRWHIQGGNNQILCCPGEGFTTKRACIDNSELVFSDEAREAWLKAFAEAKGECGP
jgi:uncharacterized protein YegP (UPF0339 family)